MRNLKPGRKVRFRVSRDVSLARAVIVERDGKLFLDRNVDGGNSEKELIELTDDVQVKNG